MEKSKQKNLLTRAATALVLVPVVVASIYYAYPYYILILLMGALLSWEWSNMVPNKKAAVYAVTYTVVVAFLIRTFPMSWWDIGSMAAMLIAASLFVWFKAKDEKHRKLLTLGVSYIGIGIGSLIWLYYIVGWVGTLWLFVIVWSVDIGGYVVGSSLKGPKLAPKISPNKTWSGLFGGMLFAALSAAAFCYFMEQTNYATYMILAACLGVVEQIGDLVESSIKRHLQIKDSSSIIPGHGGMFDRIDGLIFTAPVLIIVIIALAHLFV